MAKSLARARECVVAWFRSGLENGKGWDDVEEWEDHDSVITSVKTELHIDTSAQSMTETVEITDGRIVYQVYLPSRALATVTAARSLAACVISAFLASRPRGSCVAESTSHAVTFFGICVADALTRAGLLKYPHPAPFPLISDTDFSANAPMNQYAQRTFDDEDDENHNFGSSSSGTLRHHLIDALHCLKLSTAQTITKSIVLEIQTPTSSWPLQDLISRQQVFHAASPATQSNDYSTMNRYKSGPRTMGVTGLSNLGNTCYMNSAIQCLSNTRALTEYFLEGRHVDDVNRDNPLGMQGRLAESYAKLIHSLWRSGAAFESPSELKHVIAKFAPQFTGYQQHDSQELTSFLLDGLHEDLNRVKVKPYISLPDDMTMSDEEAATLTWDTHTKRNQSVVMDIFQGQFKSTVRCPIPECGKVSVTFDPFMYVSVPVPHQKSVTVLFFPLDGSIPRQIRILLTSRATVHQLKREMEKLFSEEHSTATTRPHFAVCDAWRILSDSDRVTSAYRQDIFNVYEIPEPQPNSRVVRVTQKHEYSAQRSHPFVVLYTPNETTAAQIYNQVRRSLSRILNAIPPTQSLENAFKITFQGSMFGKGFEDNNEVVVINERDTLSVNWLPELSKNVPEWNRLIDSSQDQMQLPTTTNEINKQVTIYNCLDLFTKEEMLGEADTWYCPSCKLHQRAALKMQLWRLPSHLIIHLKRFLSEDKFREKIDTLVDVPEIIDLADYTLGPNQSTRYRLYAVSNHSGSLYGGHYTTNAQNHVDKKWYTFNDSSCSEITADAVITQSAYLLFFQQINEAADVVMTPV
eukprot:c5515_g1_i1.p1 GENE.c5515_g1_i1~~c5515_g1_i1.p1  ORF type:complete len:902 (+),score=242.29 c5515_g1_i1:293-2707(+)